MEKKTKIYICIFFFILTSIMHLRIFNKDLIGPHLWRQSQTQINIQNFYRHDFNILNPRHNSFNGGKDNIMRMEFPIMQWSIASFYKIFGESIMVTRICMFLIGLLGVFGIFMLFKYLFNDEKVALAGAFLFNFSPVFFYYTMNPIPDVFALSTGLVSLAYFYKYYRNHKLKDCAISALFISLSILAKLPYIIFGVVPFIYLIQEFLKGKNMDKKVVSTLLNSFCIALIPPLLWYGWVIKDWGTTTIVGGIINTPLTMEKFKDILGYHLTVMWPRDLIGLSALIFFFVGLIYSFKVKKSEIYWQLLSLSIMLLLYFLYEFTLIDKVHDYYMMPFLSIFFILVTYGFKRLYNFNLNLKPLIYLLLLISPILTYFTTKSHWTNRKSFFDETLLSDRETLRNLVPSSEKCIILNDVSTYVFSYLIDKQGFIFNDDNLPSPWIEDMIKNYGVKYMYSTSRKVDESPEFLPFSDSLIYNKGNVKVMKLKLPIK